MLVQYCRGIHVQFSRRFICLVSQKDRSLYLLQYYTMPGSDVSIPVMSLGDDLMNLSISGKKKTSDPVADATRKGKIPTLGEVKRSLKVSNLPS